MRVFDVASLVCEKPPVVIPCNGHYVIFSQQITRRIDISTPIGYITGTYHRVYALLFKPAERSSKQPIFRVYIAYHANLFVHYRASGIG
jgi:hypothetical protein